MDLQEVEVLAEKAILNYGLQGWSFRWARTKRRLGACNYRLKRIEIAEFYARHNPPEQVLDTLLHEIAHALAGPQARHGPAWKAIARRLGATPKACDKGDQTVVMPGDWQATCGACNKTYHKYKRPQSLTGYRCRCSARTSLSFQFTGDPARQPIVPLTVEQAAKWEAQCSGCQTVHRRVRKPKTGVWRCRCLHRCELVWRFRPPGDIE